MDILTSGEKSSQQLWIERLDHKRCGRSVVVERVFLARVGFRLGMPMTTPPALGVVCEEGRKEDVRLTGLRRRERWRGGAAVGRKDGIGDGRTVGGLAAVRLSNTNYRISPMPLKNHPHILQTRHPHSATTCIHISHPCMHAFISLNCVQVQVDPHKYSLFSASRRYVVSNKYCASLLCLPGAVVACTGYWGLALL